MKEKETRGGLKLLLTFDRISSVEKALKVITAIRFQREEGRGGGLILPSRSRRDIFSK